MHTLIHKVMPPREHTQSNCWAHVELSHTTSLPPQHVHTCQTGVWASVQSQGPLAHTRAERSGTDSCRMPTRVLEHTSDVSPHPQATSLRSQQYKKSWAPVCRQDLLAPKN